MVDSVSLRSLVSFSEQLVYSLSKSLPSEREGKDFSSFSTRRNETFQDSGGLTELQQFRVFFFFFCLLLRFLSRSFTAVSYPATHHSDSPESLLNAITGGF